MDRFTQVRQERASQYGSYLGNMAIISQIKSQCYITVDLIESSLFIEKKDLPLVESTIDFAKTLLALKAARSLRATGDSYADCIIDFINYVRLTIEALRELGYESRIRFNEKVFNSKLNNINEDTKVESIAFLVHDEIFSQK